MPSCYLVDDVGTGGGDVMCYRNRVITSFIPLFKSDFRTVVMDSTVRPIVVKTKTPVAVIITAEDCVNSAKPMAVTRARVPGSGFTDLLAFTADGDIVRVECKLEANTEIKRKVIGQILEYAAFLWQMSYEELASYNF